MTADHHSEADAAIARIAGALDDKRLTINALDDGSGVVLDVDGERMLTANATGIAIVQAIADGHRSAAAIAGVIARHFDVPESRALEDVHEFVPGIAQGL
jgi:hypothetical protein